MNNDPRFLERKETLEKITSMFLLEDEDAVDYDFVVESVKSIAIRDSILHWLTDKYQVDLLKSEITLQDCSEQRQAFVHFLMWCALNYVANNRKTTEYNIQELVCAILLLDDQDAEFVHTAIDIMVEGAVKRGEYKADNVPFLTDLMHRATGEIPVMASTLLKASIEDVSLEDCLNTGL